MDSAFIRYKAYRPFKRLAFGSRFGGLLGKNVCRALEKVCGKSRIIHEGPGLQQSVGFPPRLFNGRIANVLRTPRTSAFEGPLGLFPNAEYYHALVEYLPNRVIPLPVFITFMENLAGLLFPKPFLCQSERIQEGLGCNAFYIKSDSQKPLNMTNFCGHFGRRFYHRIDVPKKCFDCFKTILDDRLNKALPLLFPRVFARKVPCIHRY